MAGGTAGNQRMITSFPMLGGGRGRGRGNDPRVGTLERMRRRNSKKTEELEQKIPYKAEVQTDWKNVKKGAVKLSTLTQRKDTVVTTKNKFDVLQDSMGNDDDEELDGPNDADKPQTQETKKKRNVWYDSDESESDFENENDSDLINAADAKANDENKYDSNDDNDYDSNDDTNGEIAEVEMIEEDEERGTKRPTDTEQNASMMTKVAKMKVDVMKNNNDVNYDSGKKKQIDIDTETVLDSIQPKLKITTNEIAGGTEFSDRKENKSNAAIMAERGFKMSEDVEYKSTAVAFEFNVQKEEETFNVREATRELLQVMWDTDTQLKIKSKIDNTIWCQHDVFPAGDDFTKHFVTKTEKTKFNSVKVITHMNIISEETISRIKWRPLVRNFIHEKRIWVKQDRYETAITSTPGYFIGLHPRATNKQMFYDDIVGSMEKVILDNNNNEIQKWNERNKSGDRKYPKFHIETIIRKWGQIQSEVIGVQCAKVDAQYLKYLLSSIVEQKILQDCLFVPIGIHLMTSSDVLSNLLQQHNKFLSNTATFDIFDIYPEEMLATNETSSDATLMDKISESKLIHKIERTPVTDTRGIWTMIVKKDLVEKAQAFLEHLLPHCTTKPYDRQKQNAGSTIRYNNYTPPGSNTYATYLAALANVPADTAIKDTTSTKNKWASPSQKGYAGQYTKFDQPSQSTATTPTVKSSTTVTQSPGTKGYGNKHTSYATKPDDSSTTQLQTLFSGNLMQGLTTSQNTMCNAPREREAYVTSEVLNTIETKIQQLETLLQSQRDNKDRGQKQQINVQSDKNSQEETIPTLEEVKNLIVEVSTLNQQKEQKNNEEKLQIIMDKRLEAFEEKQEKKFECFQQEIMPKIVTEVQATMNTFESRMMEMHDNIMRCLGTFPRTENPLQEASTLYTQDTAPSTISTSGSSMLTAKDT